MEAGLLQGGADRRAEGGLAVRPFDGDTAERTRADRRRQRRGGRGEGGALLPPGQQGLAAALDVQDRIAVDQDHQGARLAARPVGLGGPPLPAGGGARGGRLPGGPGVAGQRPGRSGPAGRLGPGQRGAVGVGGVRGGQHQDLRRLGPRPGAPLGGRPRPVQPAADRTQPVRGALHGELGTAQPLHEVPRRARPRSSIAASTRYTPAKPPGTRSATTVPRVTRPCRSSRLCARAVARTVGSASGAGSRDQRPATVGGPLRRAPPIRPNGRPAPP